ncbi:dihydroorotase [Bacteroidales bacterium OttesenSCG-928-A17]|nr:dihydroorotase [Bacteroidales bacterium OttesenSCG-928-A17]
MTLFIKNAWLINEGEQYKASLLIKDERIHTIYREDSRSAMTDDESATADLVIDADGLWLLPGLIDDQVHFREPGLTHKGDIHSESRAAIAGGITSYMDMPNTLPQTTTVEALNDKFDRAEKSSMANYSFFIGATNENLEELKKEGAKRAAAVKLFMGSSTGNMLVDDETVLDRIFSEVDQVIAAHCESESIIAENKKKIIETYGDAPDVKFHPCIRSAEACYASSAEAVRLAKKHHARLHLFHLSTAKEMSLLEAKPLVEKRITAEVCVHHLWFTDEDYAEKGNLIKWNPAVKSTADRDALRKALKEGKIDVVATDHAPHSLDEKQGSCLVAASGGPMVQHALVVMLELSRQGIFTPELVVEKMAHNPATLFGIQDRGFIREGYYADLVLVDPNQTWTVAPDNLLYKCAWSPLVGETFSHKVVKTIVNGSMVYNEGIFDENFRGQELCCK